MSMSFVKRQLYNAAPWLYQMYANLPYVRQQKARVLHKKLEERLCYEIEIFRRYLNDDFTVRHGPFSGMKYMPITSNSLLSAKVLGSYESPIHHWINDAIGRRYRTILDIGCAEGYYAVGFALRSETTQIYGYDIDPAARANTTALAKLNGVKDRIQIRDRCSPDDLNREASNGALIFCDIEGDEFDLLRPDLAPSLLHADVIVETHDYERRGVTETLVRRFSRSHRIEAAYHYAKSAEEFSSLKAIPVKEHALLLEEGRPHPQCWLRLTANPPDAIQPVPWW
jgi:SAM-dependent methyltransferase